MESVKLSKIVKELGYLEDEYIRLNDMKAYLFNYKIKKNGEEEKNSEVKPIKLDFHGFDVKTLDDTIEKLNSRSEELFYNLKYGSEDE